MNSKIKKKFLFQFVSDRVESRDARKTFFDSADLPKRKQSRRLRRRNSHRRRIRNSKIRLKTSKRKIQIQFQFSVIQLKKSFRLDKFDLGENSKI